MGKVMINNILNYLEEVCCGSRECAPEAEQLLAKYKDIRASIPDEYVRCLGCPTTRRNFDLGTNVAIDKGCFSEDQDSCCYEPSGCSNATEIISELTGGSYYYLLKLAKELEVVYGALE